MKPYSKRTHSTKKYQQKEGVWIAYNLKNVRRVALQQSRMTAIREFIKTAGFETKIYWLLIERNLRNGNYYIIFNTCSA